MKISFKLAIGSILVSTILMNFSSSATADQTRRVGMVAIIYDSNNNITSLASSIAIGKNTAAGTVSIVGNEAATSAFGGAGTLTVTNPNTVNVGYSFMPESDANLGTTLTNPNTISLGHSFMPESDISLGNISTKPGMSKVKKIDSKNPTAITIIF